MKLLTKQQDARLRNNGREQCLTIKLGEDAVDFEPVVKLFCPWSGATWLLTEIDPKHPDIAFGLCDLGVGSPEIGNVSLTEIAAVRGPAGLKIERDLHFKADKTLQAYADEARRFGRIKA